MCTDNFEICAIDNAATANNDNFILSNINLADFSELITKSSLELICKLYNNFSLPRNHIQSIIVDIQEMYSLPLKIVSKKCENINIKPFLDILCKPFEHLDTEYKRLKSLEAHAGFIKPVQFTVGNTLQDKKENNRVVIDYFNCNAQYIPITKILENFLALLNVLTDILSYKNY